MKKLLLVGILILMLNSVGVCEDTIFNSEVGINPYSGSWVNGFLIFEQDKPYNLRLDISENGSLHGVIIISSILEKDKSFPMVLEGECSETGEFSFVVKNTIIDDSFFIVKGMFNKPSQTLNGLLRFSHTHDKERLYRGEIRDLQKWD